MEIKTFQEAAALIDNRADAVVFTSDDRRGKVLVSPRLQGRVMTSSFAGDTGKSLGWINPDALNELDSDPKFTNYGGEDRFWLGPEGGQFSTFFDMGAPQTMEGWHVPKCIGVGSLEVRTRGIKHLVMGRAISIRNASNATFKLEITRDISLLDAEDAARLAGAELPGSVEMVAFRSDNGLKNIGEEPWSEATGLLSIWILGMFNPSNRTVVLVPYKTDARGPLLKDDYFGKVPPERLHDMGGCVGFLADGQYRSKIGVPPARAVSRLGSCDYTGNILTVVEFTLPAADRYVNSAWEHQKEPFRGDVSNSYNDGPVEPGGKSLGGFYELESSSPALELGPKETAFHSHATYHFHGPRKELAKIARATLNADLDEVEKQFFSK